MILVILRVVSYTMNLSDLSLTQHPLLYHKHGDLHGMIWLNMDPSCSSVYLVTKAFIPAHCWKRSSKSTRKPIGDVEYPLFHHWMDGSTVEGTVHPFHLL